MFGYVRLDEDGADVWIEAGGEERRAHLVRSLLERAGVVGLCDGVIVDDAVDRLHLVLQLRPVFDGAEVVPDVQLTGGLDAAEDARHRGKLLGIQERWE